MHDFKDKHLWIKKAIITDAVRDSGENGKFTNLDNELNETRYKISILQDSEKRIREELLDVVYPKHARFGFLSFIIFAGLGVIIPMAYRIWTGFLLDLANAYPIIIQYLPDVNNIVVALFSFGLALNFFYIFLDVRPSLKTKPSP